MMGDVGIDCDHIKPSRLPPPKLRNRRFGESGAERNGAAQLQKAQSMTGQRLREQMAQTRDGARGGQHQTLSNLENTQTSQHLLESWKTTLGRRSCGRFEGGYAARCFCRFAPTLRDLDTLYDKPQAHEVNYHLWPDSLSLAEPLSTHPVGGSQ